MFTYRCPTCGKQHLIDAAFQSPYDAACLRCREIVHVTRELIYAADGMPAEGPSAATAKSRLRDRFRPAGKALVAGATGTGTEASAKEDVDDPGAVNKGFDTDWAAREGDAQEKGKRNPNAAASNGTASNDKEKKSKPAPPPANIGRRRWLVMGSVAVVVVGLLVTGGYFGYGYYRKHKSEPSAEAKPAKSGPTKIKGTSSSKKVAAASPKTTTQKKTNPLVAKRVTPAAKSVTPKGPNTAKADATKIETFEPIIKPRDDKVIIISAARLASELANNPAATNEKYKGALLEVSGIFDKTEIRETVRPPKRPHLLFRCEGPAIVGDRLGTHTPPQEWARLRTQRPCTILGVYGSDGVLHGCELMPLTPPADAIYKKGKDLEVTGYVAQVDAVDRTQPFPRIVLEGETDSLLTLECLFRRDDEDKVLTVTEDMPVTIRGTCGGRHLQTNNRDVIRLNNCELVYTSAPPADRPRLTSVQLLRAYEEDLRPVLLPAAAAAPQGEKPIQLAQLEGEFAKDPKGLTKYRFRTLLVSGMGTGKRGAGGELRLTTGATDAAVAVRCRFSKRALKDLDNGPNYVIQGFCKELADPRTLVLESCECVDETGRPPARRLTADFFPHTPGVTRTYDFAQHAATSSKPQAMRLLFDFKASGLIESVVTHIGSLRTSSLFDPNEGPAKWINNARVRKVRLPGPQFRHRLFGGFVQLGQSDKPKEGAASEWFFEPVLKVGAKPGDTWRWTHGNTVHEYKLVKFDHFEAQPSALIVETITAAQDPHHPMEIQHLYVRSVGEVERRQYQRLTATEKRLVAERKLVDDARPINQSQER